MPQPACCHLEDADTLFLPPPRPFLRDSYLEGASHLPLIPLDSLPSNNPGKPEQGLFPSPLPSVLPFFISHLSPSNSPSHLGVHRSTKRGVSMAFTPRAAACSPGRRGGGRKGTLKAPLKPKLPKNLWGNLESFRPRSPDPQPWKGQHPLFKRDEL